MQLIPLVHSQERNLQEMQTEFVETLAVNYADQQLMKLIGKIPPKGRVAITLAILVTPYAIQAAKRLCKAK